MKNLYINTRFFFALIGVGILYVLAFFFPGLMWAAHITLLICFLAAMVDFLLLFNQKNEIRPLDYTQHFFLRYSIGAMHLSMYAPRC